MIDFSDGVWLSTAKLTMPDLDVSAVAATPPKPDELEDMPPQIVDANEQTEHRAVSTTSVQYRPSKRVRCTNTAHKTIRWLRNRLFRCRKFSNSLPSAQLGAAEECPIVCLSLQRAAGVPTETR